MYIHLIFLSLFVINSAICVSVKATPDRWRPSRVNTCNFEASTARDTAPVLTPTPVEIDGMPAPVDSKLPSDEVMVRLPPLPLAR